MRTLFQIPTGDSDPLRWKLVLRSDSKTLAAAGYTLECEYVPAIVASGAAKKAVTAKREGIWISAQAANVDWPQWRGPNRDDVSTETGLLKSWPPGGPKRIWVFDNAGTG
jgi:hypothetical protein